jgi:hypothetical protein
MTDAIEGFFEDLRGHHPLLRRAKGSLRVDKVDGTGSERWLVTMDEGEVSVSHRNAKADCVIRTSRDVFEGMVAGRVNAMAATLRGVLSVEGDPKILVLFQRALPGPSKPRRSAPAGRSS